MQRPTIVHYISTLLMGGEQRYLIRILNRFDPSRFEHILVYSHGDLLLGELAPHVERMTLGGAYSLRRAPDWGASALFAAKLRRFLSSRQACLAATYNPGITQLALLAAARSRGVPVVHTIQRPFGNRSPTENFTIRSRVARRVFYGAIHRFVALGSYYQRDQVNNWLIPPEKIELNPIGLDLAEYTPDQVARKQAREELGYVEDDVVIAVVARLSPEKGVSRAIDLMTNLRTSAPRARLLIVGDGPCREEIERSTTAQGLSSVVRFVGTRRDSARLMNGSDMVLQTTPNPLNGISSIEGMATGTPIVTVVERSEEELMAADTCEEGTNGLFYRLADVERSISTLAALVNDRSRRDVYGAASRRLALERFDIARHIDRLERMYDRVARPVHLLSNELS